MLWQEILFFLSLWAYCIVAFLLTFWQWSNRNYFLHTSWLIILSTQCWGVFSLSVVLALYRIKAKYSHREIEDIVIYDRSQKQQLDFDSPAILEVYFE
jgi:hypothetical protein